LRAPQHHQGYSHAKRDVLNSNRETAPCSPLSKYRPGKLKHGLCASPPTKCLQPSTRDNLSHGAEKSNPRLVLRRAIAGVPIDMAVADVHERLRRDAHLATQGQAKPQLVILAIPLLLVERAHLVNEVALDHHAGRRNAHIKSQQSFDNGSVPKARPLAARSRRQLSVRIDCADPRVAPSSVRARLHESELNFQFSIHPHIVRIDERQI
jgi:hypothetical protein